MVKDKELARLRALDTEQKARVLGHLETALKAADVHVFLSYDHHAETVHYRGGVTMVATRDQAYITYEQLI